MVHASLFSGIGGPEIAAAMLGWENAFHCEINPFGRHVLEYWFPESVSYEDITKTDFTPWRGRIDVLTGGFPCQPFSYAGKRGGREDERYLWPEMLRVIEEVRPTWVVGENVAGITTMVEGGILTYLGGAPSLFGEVDTVHEYQLRETFTIERICRDFDRIGFSVQPILIPAAAVGAPHRRDRVFILAHADNADGGSTERAPGIHESESREERLQERNKVQHAGESNYVRPESEETFADTFRERLAAAMQSGCYGAQEWYDEGRSTGMYSNDAWLEGTWWNHFPTVSPVHTRNDGLSEIMDGTSLGFNKWRNESIKAYGNAIVPQVMYRIFQTIEEIGG